MNMLCVVSYQSCQLWFHIYIYIYNIIYTSFFDNLVWKKMIGQARCWWNLDGPIPKMTSILCLVGARTFKKRVPASNLRWPAVTQADTAADRCHKKSLSMQRQGRRDTKEWFHLLHPDYCSFMPTIYGPSNFLIWRSATTIDSIFTYCFAGWNIHLPAIVVFTRGSGFWPIEISGFVGPGLNHSNPPMHYVTLLSWLTSRRVVFLDWMASSIRNILPRRCAVQ